MRRRLAASVVLFSALTCVQVARASEPLKCPAGTRLESKDMAGGGRGDWCVDSKTGLKEGPERDFRADGSLAAVGLNHAGKPHGAARTYDEHGALIGEMAFDQGEMKSMRLTRAGLDRLAAEMNEGFRSRNQPAEVRVTDESSLAIDFHFPDANAKTGAEKLEGFRKYVHTGFCKLFTGAGEQLQSIQIRVLNNDSPEPQLDTELTRAECAAAG